MLQSEVSSCALKESRGLIRTTVSVGVSRASVSAKSAEEVSWTVISSSERVRRSLYPPRGYTTVSGAYTLASTDSGAVSARLEDSAAG